MLDRGDGARHMPHTSKPLKFSARIFSVAMTASALIAAGCAGCGGDDRGTAGTAGALASIAAPGSAAPLWHAPPAVTACFKASWIQEIAFGVGATELEAFNRWRDGITYEAWIALDASAREELVEEQRESCRTTAKTVRANRGAEATAEVDESLRCCLAAAESAPTR